MDMEVSEPWAELIALCHVFKLTWDPLLPDVVFGAASLRGFHSVFHCYKLARG